MEIISLVLDYSYPYLPKPNIFTFQIIQSIIDLLILGFGSDFYLIANLGSGPRDGLINVFTKISKFPIFLVRSLIEIFAISIGWFLGSSVGFGTIIFSFLLVRL